MEIVTTILLGIIAYSLLKINNTLTKGLHKEIAEFNFKKMILANKE